MMYDRSDGRASQSPTSAALGRANSSPPLSFQAFVDYLARGLETQWREVAPDTCLAEDLGLDSLSRVELALALEELQVDAPAEWLSAVTTLGDYYELYTLRIEQNQLGEETRSMYLLIDLSDLM